MKKHFVTATGLAMILTLPLIGRAQSAKHHHIVPQSKADHAKMMSAAVYVCPVCHHKASAALAKQVHYVCPVDGGKLILIKPAKK